jgi:hypothetical protein
MTDAKRPLSIRVPEAIYRKIKMLADDTEQSISQVAVSLLGAGVGDKTAATPGDRLAALEKEVASLRGKLMSLAKN